MDLPKILLYSTNMHVIIFVISCRSPELRVIIILVLVATNSQIFQCKLVDYLFALGEHLQIQ